MFSGWFILKRRNLFARALHLGKQFSNPSSEDIVFKAICENIRRKRWKLVEQVCSGLTTSMLSRIFREFIRTPSLALEFYRRIGDSNVVLDSLESSCILIHVMVNQRNYDVALFLLKELMISRGHSVQEILREMIAHAEVGGQCSGAFDALVRACTQMGATEDAYYVIKTLRLAQYFVSIHAWNNFLNHLLKLDKLGRFWFAYSEMLSYSYSENVNTFNLVIFALCKESELPQAISVFYRMLKKGLVPNVVACNMLVDGSCRMGNLDLALKLIRNMGIMSRDNVNPNSVTYNCLINGFAKSGSPATAERFLDEMIKKGVEPNVTTYATLVDGYTRNGHLEEAFRLCSDMVTFGIVPNSVIYNTIMHSLCLEGDINGAFCLLSDMIKRSIYPDEFTYSILAKGLCRIGRMTDALKFHRFIVEKNMVEDACLPNILIDYLSQSKGFLQAKQLLCSMFVRGLVPDMVTYGSIIAGYLKDGEMENALDAYDDMIKVERKANLVVYNSILDGLCKRNAVDAARSLVDTLKRTTDIDIVTFNTMLNGYCTSGKIDEAMRLFFNSQKEGLSGNTVTYNILINYMCKAGLIQQALKLVEIMVNAGLSPDCITYTILITNISKQKGAEEVIKMHDQMVLLGVTPDSETYRAIVQPLIASTLDEFGLSS